MIITVIIALVSIIAAFIFTLLQINEMRKAEKGKRIIAIQSLIFELEHNKDLVTQYIEHCTIGAHLGTQDGKEIYTWEYYT